MTDERTFPESPRGGEDWSGIGRDEIAADRNSWERPEHRDAPGAVKWDVSGDVQTDRALGKDPVEAALGTHDAGSAVSGGAPLPVPGEPEHDEEHQDPDLPGRAGVYST
jgi:hypothetical protein